MPIERQMSLGSEIPDDTQIADATNTDVQGDGDVALGGKEAPGSVTTQQPEAKPLYSEFGLGDDFKDKSPDDLARYFHQQLSSVGKTMRDRESAIYGSPEYREFLEFKKTRGKQPEEPKKEEKPLWNPPEFNEREVDLWTVTDENGRRQWKQGTPPEIVRRASDYYTYIQEWDSKFRRNPYDALQPFVGKTVEETLNKMLDERLTERDSQRRMLDYEKQNAKWIYELDDNGNPIVGDDGRWKMNPLGKATLETAQYISKATSDQVELVELARSLVRAQYIEKEYEKLKKSQEAEETQLDKNRAFNKKAAEKTADRGGTLPRPGGKDSKFPTNRKKSFMEQAREALTEAGVTGDKARWD